MSSPDLTTVFPQLSIGYIEGTARSVRYRQGQCRRLNESLLHYKVTLVEALRNDFGFTELEALFEYSLALLELKQHYESLSLDEEVAASKAIAQSRLHAGRSVGSGIVYIIPQKGLLSVISPLSAALVAGNCVIVELPQTTMRTTLALRELLTKSLSRDTLALTNKQPTDSILSVCTVVTQSQPRSSIAHDSLVRSPSASQSFAFVDRSADAKLAAQHLVASRFAFSGTSAYAPDVVYVHEAILGLLSSNLIPIINAALNGGFGSADTKGAGDKKRLQTKTSLSTAAEAAGATVLFSSPRGYILQTDEISLPRLAKSLQASPAVPPVLLLCVVSSMEIAIDVSAEYPHFEDSNTAAVSNPAGAFIFANSLDAQYISNSVDADLSCINDFPSQLMVGPRLPKLAPLRGMQTNLTPRYQRSLFECQRSIVLPRTVPGLPEDVIRVTQTKEGQAKFFQWCESMAEPLKPQKQGEVKDAGIFDHGILLTASLVGIPLLTGLGFLGKFAFGYLSSARARSLW